MKTQMQTDVLALNKSAMVELNDAQMMDVDSGWTPTPTIVSVSAGLTLVGAGAAVGYGIYYLTTQI